MLPSLYPIDASGWFVIWRLVIGNIIEVLLLPLPVGEFATDYDTRFAVERLDAALALAFLPLFLLVAAPSEKAVTRRLIFLAIGLILLIVLNEISKLHELLCTKGWPLVCA